MEASDSPSESWITFRGTIVALHCWFGGCALSGVYGAGLDPGDADNLCVVKMIFPFGWR